MKKLYVPRRIQSCYFDNHNLTLFSNSEEGVLPRKKIRLRWYNDDNNFTKETKISSIEGRYKYSEKFQELKKISDINSIRFYDNLYGLIFPVILVGYIREYYLFHDFRVTFDTNIEYQSFNNKQMKFRDNECVMEVKAPIFCGDDFIEKYICYANSRFSKYSRGIIHTNQSL